MKKFLLCAGAMSAFAAGAQTVVAADTLYTGLNADFYVIDSSVVDYAAVIGTGVTWNYSTALGVTDGGPIINNDMVQNASASSYAAHYPMAAYNENMNGGASQFFSNNADSTTVWGFVFSVDTYEIIIKHNVNPLIGLKYPMNVGDTYADITAGEVEIAGNTGITDGTANVTVDGSGTLLVSGNTHTNITRVKLVENINTSIEVFPFPPTTGTVTRTIYSYYDFANGQLPIFIHANITVTSDLFDGGYDAVYYSGGLPGYAGVNEATQASLSVYPNPANGVATVTTDGTADQFEVVNALGQVVLTVNAPQAVEQVDVTGFEAGTYVIRVKKGEAITTEKLVIR
jgi:hypothetical protein